MSTHNRVAGEPSVKGGVAIQQQAPDEIELRDLDKIDERLECEDVPLFDNKEVMAKLTRIIDQLGDLKSIKIDDTSHQKSGDLGKQSGLAQNSQEAGKKSVEVNAANKVDTNNEQVAQAINKAIQKMIVEINERGFIILPHGRFKMVWDTIMALALLWSITVSPLRISIWFMEDFIFVDVGDMIVDLFFLADFILKFFTGFYQYGRLIKKKKKIARRYMKNKFVFIIDLVTSIPINYLVPNGPYSSINFQPIDIFQNNSRLLRYIRATKMVRYLRIFKEIEGFVDILTFKQIKSVVMKKMCETFIVTVSYFIISACLWYICGIHNINDRDNWLFRLGYIDKDSWTILLASLYWTIQTIFTVGYGDIPALTKLEMVFSIFTQIFGSIILSYIYASMAIFIKYLNQEKESKRYTIDYLKKVRRKYNLNQAFIKTLIKKIKEETENLIEDLNLICDGLEPELVRVLKLSVFKKKYQDCQDIIKKNDDFIFYFGSHFKHLEVTKSKMICREGELPSKMYFIVKGTVEIFRSSLPGGRRLGKYIMTDTGSFGDAEYWDENNSKRRAYNVKAVSDKVELYTLAYDVFRDFIPKMIEKEYQELSNNAAVRYEKILDVIEKEAEPENFNLDSNPGGFDPDLNRVEDRDDVPGTDKKLLEGL